ncbi:hypothetical protein RDI58_023527 [Solanum bulbocastanum]
MTKKN